MEWKENGITPGTKWEKWNSDMIQYRLWKKTLRRNTKFDILNRNKMK